MTTIKDLEGRISALEKQLATMRRRLYRHSPMRTNKAETWMDAGELKDALRSTGWTNAMLARAMGVSRNSVIYWCHGTARISEERAQIIRDVFLNSGAEPPPVGARPFSRRGDGGAHEREDA